MPDIRNDNERCCAATVNDVNVETSQYDFSDGCTVQASNCSGRIAARSRADVCKISGTTARRLIPQIQIHQRYTFACCLLLLFLGFVSALPL
jgi:hypothetical protein